MPQSSYSYLYQLKSCLNFRTHVPKTNHKLQIILRTEWSLVQKMWFLQDSSPAFIGGGGPRLSRRKYIASQIKCRIFKGFFYWKMHLSSLLQCGVCYTNSLLRNPIPSNQYQVYWMWCEAVSIKMSIFMSQFKLCGWGFNLGAFFSRDRCDNDCGEKLIINFNYSGSGRIWNKTWIRMSVSTCQVDSRSFCFAIFKMPWKVALSMEPSKCNVSGYFSVL